MSAVASYQQALREVVEARAQLRAVLKSARQVVEVLHEWEKKDARGVNGEIERASLGWPSRELISEAVNAWKTTALKMHHAWQSVPDGDRVGLISPDQFKGE